MKRAIALMCAGIIAATMFMIINSSHLRDEPGGHASKLFEKPVELSVLVGSHSSWPYNENWKFWSYFREATGVDIKVTAVSNFDILTKANLMLAVPENLVDMMHFGEKWITDDFARVGAVVAIDDYIEYMPNYTRFWASVPKDERRELLMQRVSFDGKTYFPQVYGSDRSTNVRAWLYRSDIFKKHGLSAPTTMAELYSVCRKLKRIYPESYPLCLRSGIGIIGVMGPSWSPYFSPGVFYNYTTEKWCYGETMPIMREIVEFLSMMRAEGLVPPDWVNIAERSWEELVVTDRGFIMPEYSVRMDYFNVANQVVNPEFNIEPIMPPRAAIFSGQNRIGKYNVDPSGYVVCNTRKPERIKNSIKLLDWMYSDEAAELLSWGKEGETYTETDGVRRFILPEGARVISYYGAYSYGLYQRLLPEALASQESEQMNRSTDYILAYTEEHFNPYYWVSLTDSEQKIADEIGSGIDSFSAENMAKFLLGQRSISEWDSFVAELKDMGVDELLKVYDSAYKRARRFEG